MTKEQTYMVFDVESVGLHGMDFSVGWVVVSQDGTVLDSGIETCEINDTFGNPDALEWCRKNIPTLKITQPHPAAVREEFWRNWTRWRLSGALLVADCAWPVEARFLINCIDESPDEREWKGPYPLIDVGSVLLARGVNPLERFPRKLSELPEHNPFNDARQSARILLEHLHPAYEVACEQEGPDPSRKALSDALRDAISTYGPKPEIVVTEERQETWKAVLEKYGV